MFSETLRKYARDTFLWTSFWVITGAWGAIGWTYACIFIRGLLVPPGPERIPLVLAYFTGLGIFAITYFLTLGRWRKERAEAAKEAERAERARRYA